MKSLQQTRIAVISFDVEQDCPPYLDTYRGVEEGLPKILDLLREKRIRATFFFTALTAKKYPHLARRVVDEGHELGCHSYAHERLDRIDLYRARHLLEKATQILRGFYEVTSFRAPNLKLPPQLLPLLGKLGYTVDSSLALYKPPFPRGPQLEEGLVRIPATTTSSVLRLPWPLQRRIHSILPNPRVYFSHPWEYVDMRGRGLKRYDCVFNTGDTALKLLGKLVDYLQGKSYKLLTMKQLADELTRLPRANFT